MFVNNWRSMLCLLHKANAQLISREAAIVSPALHQLPSLASSGSSSPVSQGVDMQQGFSTKAFGKRTQSRAEVAAEAAAAAAAAEAEQARAAALSSTTSMLRPLELVDTNDVGQQQKMTLDGRPLSGDPCTPKFTAPVYIPEPLRVGMPRVLFTDPWTPVEDIELRHDHTHEVYKYLGDAERPLTATEVFEGMNSTSPSSPMFGSLTYVKELLEHLRARRMIKGQRNPQETTLSHGHPDHPRLYSMHLFQQAEKGSPRHNALAKEAAEKKKVEKALRRMRNGKSPYQIHRRRAYISAFQYELAVEAVRQARAN